MTIQNLRSRGHGLLGQLLSQVATSAANFALSAIALRILDSRELGKFAVIYSIIIFATVATRGVCTYPILYGADASGPAALEALSLASACGLIFSSAACIVVFAIRAPTNLYWVAAGILFAVLEDSHRYIAFGRDDFWSAAKSDSVWLIVQLAAMFSGLLLDWHWLVLAGWAAGALAGLFLAEVVNKTSLRWPLSPIFLRRNLRLRTSTTIESSFSALIYQFTPSALAIFSGYAVSGILRGAQTILGPASTAAIATYPTVTRRTVAAPSLKAASRIALVATGGLTLAISAYMLTLHLAPAQLVHAAFGPRAYQFMRTADFVAADLTSAMWLTIGLMVVHKSQHHLTAAAIRIVAAVLNVALIVSVTRLSSITAGLTAVAVANTVCAASCIMPSRVAGNLGRHRLMGERRAPLP